MSKMIALALFVGGILMVLLGIFAFGSERSDVPVLMTTSAFGGPLILLVGGVVLTLAGVIGLARSFKGYSKAFRSSTDVMI